MDCSVARTPTSHTESRHCLISHCIFAAKFMSSFRLLNGVLQAATTNYMELTREVEPVCLLCSGHPLFLEYRMCVGVVENETGWGGYGGWDQVMKDFLCHTIEFVFIVCIGSGEQCKDFSMKMM